jgi:outer membrane lipoprotein-sorting protein
MTFLGGKALVLAGAVSVSSVLLTPQEQAGQERLAGILKKSAEYCRRLDKAALDFVCLEEVTETSRHYTLATDVYLYDYQFIRKSGKALEKRNLISVNGKKANIQDTSLDTVIFQYKNVFFGPVGLLSKSWQADLAYKLIGEDIVHGEKAVVIEATPGLSLAGPHCTGRIWIREADGSVLKIIWDQKSLGNFQSLEEWAKAHEARPQITAFSEYGLEKNGLRFPTRSFVQNAYVRKDGRTFVSGEMSVIYKNYRFFTVETEIKY